MKYQNGSLRKKTRKSGEQVWEFRYRDASGSMRQRTLKQSEHSSAASAKIALQTLVFALNDPSKMNKTTPFGMVIERFIVEEKLREIAAQPEGAVTISGMSYSTALRYLSCFKCHLLPKWAEVPIEAIRPMDVQAWLKSIDSLANTTKGGIKALMHNLFERAMFWDLMEIQRNPIELVKVKGSSVRKKKKVILTVEQFHQLRNVLPEPYKTMVTFAICTGLRVSEVTGLRSEHIKNGALLVQASNYKGRIGAVKTQASGENEIPLHPDILRTRPDAWRGLVFESPEGGPYDGNTIQQQVLRPAGRALFGVDNLGWHSLRHTYRALLDETGTPPGVQQKLMRHANISTTMNVYGTSVMSSKREANNKVVEMVVGRLA
jgi:integrase